MAYFWATLYNSDHEQLRRIDDDAYTICKKTVKCQRESIVVMIIEVNIKSPRHVVTIKRVT